MEEITLDDFIDRLKCLNFESMEAENKSFVRFMHNLFNGAGIYANESKIIYDKAKNASLINQYYNT